METTRFRVIFLNEDVIKEFQVLPKTIQTMMNRAIKERLEIDPIGVGKPLQYSLKGSRRLRINSYRIIYVIDMKKRIVIITAIGDRKDIYEST